MAKAATSELAVVAAASFVGSVDGTEYHFREGEAVKPDHPAVRKWPQLFRPQTYRHDEPVRIEAATAAPGELR
jgi:hypothetical protein